MSFGKNLAKVRKEKGLTQEELVKISGVAISQIRRYETDKSIPFVICFIGHQLVDFGELELMVFFYLSCSRKKAVKKNIAKSIKMFSILLGIFNGT